MIWQSSCGPKPTFGAGELLQRSCFRPAVHACRSISGRPKSDVFPSYSVVFISHILWRVPLETACISLCLVRRSYAPKSARIRADGRKTRTRRSRATGGASHASAAR